MRSYDSFQNISETFFGAILGAWLGLTIEGLGIYHSVFISLIVAFFIILPWVLMKVERLETPYVILALIWAFSWPLLFFWQLHIENVVQFETGIGFLIIFFGWILSITSRRISIRTLLRKS